MWTHNKVVCLCCETLSTPKDRVQLNFVVSVTSCRTRQYPAPSKSTLPATYLYLAWHRLTMNRHKMLASAVNDLFVGFHDDVPVDLLGHANALIGAKEICCPQGKSFLRYFWLRSDKHAYAHTHTYTYRSPRKLHQLHRCRVPEPTYDAWIKRHTRQQN